MLHVSGTGALTDRYVTEVVRRIPDLGFSRRTYGSSRSYCPPYCR